jgi:hypothetical protein
MIEAELPDGTVLEFPAGTSPDVVQKAVRQRLGVNSTASSAEQEKPAPSMLRQALGAAGNLLAGGVRGAGSIGSTLLAPIDVASDLIAGKGLTLESNRARRAAIDSGMRELGADTESPFYKIGKIGTEVAGTAGVGGVMARGAQAANASPVLVQALRSSGMSAGASTPARDMAARVAGGALTGGASAAIVNPEEAADGAMFGAALPVALRAARAGVDVGRNIIGATTGVGEKALATAYESGKAGGTKSKMFRENMRGTAEMTDVLDDARANLEAMRQARSADYRANMANVRADKTVLDLAPIEQSVQNTINRFTFQGQARNPKVLDALNQVADEVNAWKQLDPARFHTPEGLDALKQRIGAINESIPFESRSARSAVSDVYGSVKRQIENQAPEYSKAMKDYNEASDLLNEITRSLSQGQRSTADTAMRKLQSVMRNNVNTNYGTRVKLVEELERQGGLPLMPALAGQALNDFMPRGIQRATSIPTAGAAGITGGIPAAAATAMISSPRLMGEAAYLAGRGDPVVQALRRQFYLTNPVLAAQE